MRNFSLTNCFAPINSKFLENPERFQNCPDEKITHGLVKKIVLMKFQNNVLRVLIQLFLCFSIGNETTESEKK